MLVGDVLYHTKGFRKSLASFGNILGLGSLLIGQFAPFFVRPVVGFVAGVVVRVYRRRALKFMVPAARERINNIKRKKEDPGWEYEAPLDIMQWVILACPDGSAEEIAAVILSLVGFFLLSSYVYLIAFWSYLLLFYFSLIFLLFFSYFSLFSFFFNPPPTATVFTPPFADFERFFHCSVQSFPPSVSPIFSPFLAE